MTETPAAATKKENAAKSDSAKENTSEIAARLTAVQAVYENLMTGREHKDIARDYLTNEARSADIKTQIDMDIAPNRALFSKIMTIIAERGEDVKTLVGGHYTNKSKALEPLLSAILLCGAAEIFAATEDKAIVINDYLDLTHGFYDKSTVKLVNGILDGIAKTLAE